MADVVMTKGKIAGAFDALADRGEPADTVVIHFSGHSLLEGTYLIVHDTLDARFGVSAAELHSWLQAIPSRHKTIVLDSTIRRIEELGSPQVPVLIGDRDDLVFGVRDVHLWPRFRPFTVTALTGRLGSSSTRSSRDRFTPGGPKRSAAAFTNPIQEVAAASRSRRSARLHASH
jgi:hypothetical protein